MNKILFFDFDDTLSYNKEPVCEELCFELRRLSRIYKVVIATGQPAFYISGVLRQIGGMDEVSIIGENGAVILSDFKNPPLFHYTTPLDNSTKALFSFLKNEIVNAYGDNNLFFSAHKTALNVCPRFECQKEDIYEFFKKNTPSDNSVFKHSDTVEILAANINKANGIKKFLEIQGINREEVVLYAFGDSANDIKMFDFCDRVHLIGDKIQYIGEHIKLEGEKDLVEFLKNNF